MASKLVIVLALAVVAQLKLTRSGKKVEFDELQSPGRVSATPLLYNSNTIFEHMKAQAKAIGQGGSRLNSGNSVASSSGNESTFSSSSSSSDVDAMIDAIKIAMNELTISAKNVADDILNSAVEFNNAMAEKVKGAMDATANQLNKIQSVVKDGFSDATSGLAGKASTAVSAMQDAVAAVGSATKDNIASAQQAMDKAAQAVEDLSAAGSQQSSAQVQAVVDSIEQALENTQTVFGSMKKKVGSESS